MSFGAIAASYFTLAGGGGSSQYANAVLADNPLAFYQFDETSGTTMADSSGNGNDGIYSAGVTVGSYAITTGPGRSAGFSNDIGGTTDYRATVPYGSWMNTNELTVAFTCFLEPMGYFRLLASRYGEPGTDWSWFVYGASGTLRFHWRSSGGTNTNIDTGFTPVRGTKYYVAAYVNASESGIRVYDATGLVGQATGAGGTVNSSSRPLTLMNAATGNYTANGHLDDVVVLGSALSTARLDTLAGIALTPQPKWINRTAGVSARNGTTSHAVSFIPTSAGSLLVAVISTPAASSAVTAGWTKRVAAHGTYTECAVYTRSASAGDATIQLSVSISNVPLHYTVYEFPVGSSWHSSVSVMDDNVYPVLTGLPGSSPVTVFACVSDRRLLADTAGESVAWRYFWRTELSQETLYGGGTDGIFTGIGVIDEVYDTAVDVDAMDSHVETNGSGSPNRVVFAINVA